MLTLLEGGEVRMNPMGREILTLAPLGEVMPYDFTDLGEDASYLMYNIHWIAKQELMSRNVLHVYDWSARTVSILIGNQLTTIGHVCSISLDNINHLQGCGFKTRKEVYLTFRSIFNMKLKQWNPDEYLDKYRFIGEG